MTEGALLHISTKMTARDIIAEVARLRKVEEIVEGVVRRDLTPTDEDGCQLIYEYLLRYDEDRIVELWEAGQLGFFIHGIARRQMLGSRCAPQIHQPQQRRTARALSSAPGRRSSRTTASPLTLWPTTARRCSASRGPSPA